MNVIDLGLLAYAEAFERQRAVHADVVAGDAPPTLILVEHEPVITISRRKAAPQHLLVDQQTLAQRGIDVQPTDRGGDITYHGPGQLVAYPIIRLNDLRLNVGRYMKLLEQIIIDTLAVFNVKGVRDEAGTGVWVDGKAESGKRKAAGEQTSNLAKVAAIGVRISRGVSMHGLALNVTTDLSHFETIIPCGLADKSVTSLKQLFGDAVPTMTNVKQALINAATEHLGVSFGQTDAK